MIFSSSVFTFGKMKLANIYLFKVKHYKKVWNIWHKSDTTDVFIVNFQQISHLFLEQNLKFDICVPNECLLNLRNL